MFTEALYREIIRENQYDEFEFHEFSFGLRHLTQKVLSENWLCHNEAQALAVADSALEPVGFTTGFGLSGVPHVGTISQMLNAIVLQRQGFHVQVVLGDLDAYNARNQKPRILRERAIQYRAFLIELGFDTALGVLRDQWSHPEIVLESYLLGNRLIDEDFAETKEYTSDLYIAAGVFQGVTFPVKLAILLMLADFTTYASARKRIVVLSGLDEHKYVKLARNAQRREGNYTSIGGMYSRMNRGFNGFPKMSKSIPGSALTVDMTEDQIVSLIKGESDSYETAEDSIIFQMLQGTSAFFERNMDDVRSCAQARNEGWRQWKEVLIADLLNISRRWPK